jgi:hypothetical protein
MGCSKTKCVPVELDRLFTALDNDAERISAVVALMDILISRRKSRQARRSKKLTKRHLTY